jgi:hypothetical protein
VGVWSRQARRLDLDGRMVRAARAAVPAIDRACGPTASPSCQLDASRPRPTCTSIAQRHGPGRAPLSPGAAADPAASWRGDEQQLTAEPRVLADGRTVLVNTFTWAQLSLDG